MFTRGLLAILLVFMFSGCAEHDHAAVPKRAINYEKYGITRLKVGEIRIVNTFVPTYHAPNVEHELFLPPYIALRDWARSRFRAIGSSGVAEVEILDASIIQKDIPVKHEILGIPDNSIRSEFRMRLEVRITINSPNYADLPYVDVVVVRRINFPEQTTLADRDALFENTLAEAMDKFNDLTTQNIRNKWGSIIE